MTPNSSNDSLPMMFLNIFLILAWLIPMLVALWYLRKRNLEETAKAVWVLVIALLPIIGPITYFMLSDKPKVSIKK